MASAGAIRAGEAYVAIGARLDQLRRDLLVAEGILHKWSKRLAGIGARVGAVGGVLAVPLTLGIKAAADFEEQMAEVAKVTDPETARALGVEIRALARSMPIAHRGLVEIAADAARFGIRGVQNIRAFTETVARMAVATELSASEAGMALARLSNLTRTPVAQVENLGAAINELSNTFATSTAEIVDGALRASAAMSQLGLSQAEILGLVAALNATSESAERAGTRLRRLASELMEPRRMRRIADALGVSVSHLRRWRTEAPLDVIKVMISQMEAGGRAAERLREALSVQSATALAALAQNTREVQRALDTANQSFREGTSLNREYAAYARTVNARVRRLVNVIRDMFIALGQHLLPTVGRIIDRLAYWADAVRLWVERNGEMIKGIAKAVAGLLGLGAAFLALSAATFVVKMATSPLFVMLAAVWAISDALTETELGFFQLTQSVRVAGMKIGDHLTSAMMFVAERVLQMKAGALIAWESIKTGARLAALGIKVVFWEAVTFIDVIWNRLARAIVSALQRPLQWIFDKLHELVMKLPEKLRPGWLEDLTDVDLGGWIKEADRQVEQSHHRRLQRLSRYADEAAQITAEFGQARQEINERIGRQMALWHDARQDFLRRMAAEGEAPSGGPERRTTWEDTMTGWGKTIEDFFSGGLAMEPVAEARGTFSASALWGFGAGSTLDRIADAAEAAEEHLDKLEDNTAGLAH